MLSTRACSTPVIGVWPPAVCEGMTRAVTSAAPNPARKSGAAIIQKGKTSGTRTWVEFRGYERATTDGSQAQTRASRLEGRRLRYGWNPLRAVIGWWLHNAWARLRP